MWSDSESQRIEPVRGRPVLVGYIIDPEDEKHWIVYLEVDGAIYDIDGYVRLKICSPS